MDKLYKRCVPLTLNKRLIYNTKMNIKSIFCIFFIFVSFHIYPQETGIDMMETGYVKQISYIINGIEEEYFMDFFTIAKKNNGFYELGLQSNPFFGIEYWGFKIINIKDNEKTINGQLVDINYKNMNGISYIDNNANGNIEINLETKLVTVEILFHKNKDSEKNYKFIWENNRKILIYGG